MEGCKRRTTRWSPVIQELQGSVCQTGRMSQEDKVDILVAEPSTATGPTLEVPPDSCETAVVLKARPWQSWERASGLQLSARLQVIKSGLHFLNYFYFILFFEHTKQYAARYRLGTFLGFPGSSLCQHFMISPSPSSGHCWHLPFLCISSKSVRSIKGGSVLITILDTKSSFMSPPRQYYLYFNTSEYSH